MVDAVGVTGFGVEGRRATTDRRDTLMGRMLHLEHTYDAAPAAVAEMLLDPEFRTAVCVAQEALSHEARITRTGASARVELDQVQAVRGVPSVVTKLVGDTITLHQVETWSSATQAAVDVRIEGQSGGITGTNVLQERGAATVQVIAWEIEVKIPLIGKKVSEIVADLMGEALAIEHRTGQEWLAR